MLAAWRAFVERQAAQLNLLLSMQRQLADHARALSRIEWRLKAMQADAQSDWADDNRRTSVLPMPGDRG